MAAAASRFEDRIADGFPFREPDAVRHSPELRVCRPQQMRDHRLRLASVEAEPGHVLDGRADRLRELALMASPGDAVEVRRGPIAGPADRVAPAARESLHALPPLGGRPRARHAVLGGPSGDQAVVRERLARGGRNAAVTRHARPSFRMARGEVGMTDPAALAGADLRARPCAAFGREDCRRDQKEKTRRQSGPRKKSPVTVRATRTPQTTTTSTASSLCGRGNHEACSTGRIGSHGSATSRMASASAA